MPLVVGMLALCGCPGDDAVPMDTESSSTGEPTLPTTGPGPTTVDPDTSSSTAVDPDSSSDGGEVCMPECPEGQCCLAGSCFDASEPVCSPACDNTQVCQFPEGTDPCQPEPGECVTCGLDEPSYDPCIDVECPAGSVCITNTPTTFAVCAFQGCGDDPCACPLPPNTGNAPNACGNFTGDDGGGSCYLDCADADCPDDMACLQQNGQSLCAWITSDCCIANGSPGCEDMTCQDAVCGVDPFCCSMEWDQICADQAPLGCPELCPGAPPTLDPWGDCVNLPDPCPFGDVCLARADFGSCSTINCVDETDCPAPPPGGDAPATCQPILDMGMTNACVLDCSMGQTCPTGMVCGLDMFCGWPILDIAFENCGDSDTVCEMGEVCLSDGDMMMDPTWAVCGEQTCMDVADCQYDPPPGGDAPLVCGDPTAMGGPNTCYLDCAGGMITCPDGMTCINDTLCAWPQGTPIFEDDFETGDFSMGWTLNNVDGNMPNMNVAFVNDAWVVSDMVGGPNFSAVSTSWYEPVSQSDDWLISPQIMLGPSSRLYWTSVSIDPMFPDGYELRISTAGTTVADFMANPPLFVTPAEEEDLTARFVDLAAAGYANQQIHLAWRNNTDDGFLLLVDDVSVVEVP